MFRPSVLRLFGDHKAGRPGEDQAEYRDPEAGHIASGLVAYRSEERGEQGVGQSVYHIDYRVDFGVSLARDLLHDHREEYCGDRVGHGEDADRDDYGDRKLREEDQRHRRGKYSREVYQPGSYRSDTVREQAVPELPDRVEDALEGDEGRSEAQAVAQSHGIG